MRKTKRAKGEEYVNTAQNIVARKVLQRVECKCAFNCATPEKLQLYEDTHARFYEIGDKNSQDTYLAGLIKVDAVTRRTTNEVSSRNRTMRYNIRGPNGFFRVCKAVFETVHSIKKDRIKRIADLIQTGVFAPKDMRGLHNNRPNKIESHILAQIHAHIQSFPRKQNHYGGVESRNMRYLSPDLSVAKMHQMYCDRFEVDSSPLVSYDFYLKYFNEKFKLSFGTPRSDTCKTCDEYKVQIAAADTDEEKERLEQTKIEHHNMMEAWYADLHDKEHLRLNGIEVLCFDYQQNVPLPTLTTSETFYNRQLWIYDFCVYRQVLFFIMINVLDFLAHFFYF